MYFSFENKEALLRAILEPLVENYEKMLAKSMQIELENPSEGPEIDVYVMQFILKHRKETIVIMEGAGAVTKDSESVLKNDGAVISYILPEQT